MTPRTARIVADYITGSAVEEIASQNEVSQVRVYQILSGTLRQLGYPKIEQARKRPELALCRLRDSLNPPMWIHNAKTPEDFFHELLSEPRTITT